MTEERRSRVAVACQGGGSHTAFTAGVLDRLLSDPDPAHEIVALTGTSGGAICAFLAWYGLANTADEPAGRARARKLLDQVWHDVAAGDPVTAAANRAGVWWARARDSGAPLPQVSPYASGASVWTERYLRSALERAVPPDELARVVDAQQDEPTGPTLHIGAVDVTRGTFRTFTERDVTIDAVLASAAVPTVFRAATVEDDGETRQYWDGLFSQNPPLRDLLAGRSRAEKPEEIWLVRINPQRRDDVPTTLETIGDRRNELGGNLSVSQELAFIRRVNEWVADGSLPERYQQVAVRTIGLDETRLDPPRSLGPASKLDCRPSFIEELTTAGRAAADRFLAAERNRRLVRGTVEAVWTDSPAASAYLADDFVLHAAGAPSDRGPAVYDAYVDRFRDALDDLSVRIESDVADGDRVALVFTVSGRHVGRLFGVDPTDERVSLRGVQIARVSTDDRADAPDVDDTIEVAEAWVSVDDAGFAWALDDAGIVADADDVPVPKTSPTPVVADLQSTDESRALGIAHAERLWGGAGGDDVRAVARRLLAADHAFRRAAHDVDGRDAYVSVVESYRDAFPNLRVTVRDAVAEGDRIVVRAAMTGTHEGTFEGLEPTGRRVEAHWTFVHELADGRIATTGMIDNHRWLREQLSVRPVSPVHAVDASTERTG
ncbi:ester cyclase [Salinigranum salinum]|uniref:ester cyclase n=1 Tax=Salinigranum salinum TaxID=1364937 RepID=UPI001260ACCF|nr:ester cyclase [Salinigranum salinum]